MKQANPIWCTAMPTMHLVILTRPRHRRQEADEERSRALETCQTKNETDRGRSSKLQ